MRCSWCGLCGYDDLDDLEGEERMMRTGAGEEAAAFRPAPGWKVMLRKARRKLKGTPRAHSFHYDALSYAMNFDEQGSLLHQPSRTVYTHL